MNCARCQKWTEDPDVDGLCRGCYDYANCRYPTEARLSAVETMMADSRRELALWKARALRAEAELDAAESCHDPSCGAPCGECWKKGKRRVSRVAAVNALVEWCGSKQVPEGSR